MQRRLIIPFLAVMAMFLTVSVAQARSRGGCPNSGAGYAAQAQLPPEQAQKVQAIAEKHQQAAQELRQKIWAKNTELEALVNSGKADRKDIQELTGDIAELHNKLTSNRRAMAEQIAEVTGQPVNAFGAGTGCGYGGGYGKGACGADGGRGWHGRGRGGCGACPNSRW